MQLETAKQRATEGLWSREGGHCVSILVADLAKMHSNATSDEVDTTIDDVYEVCSQLVHTCPLCGDEAKQDDVEWTCTACPWVGDEPEEEAREAYEHWIVSDWLAEKLRDKGEMVGELHGLTIWGRCTTGQAIALDGVMQEIAKDLGLWEEVSVDE